MGLVKMLRLLRLFRMARLMHELPELMAMIKGVRMASRAVISSLGMLVLLVYVFSVIIYTLLEGQEQRDLARWDTLGLTMWTLFVDGTLIDNLGVVTRGLLEIG